jgi:glycosyltransferase involved in cell wall biosynthesis
VPAVSTPIGAEGLDFSSGELRVADEPEAFAEAVVRLLDDPGVARLQAAAARRRVEAAYGWDRIGATFAEALRRRAEPRG